MAQKQKNNQHHGEDNAVDTSHRQGKMDLTIPSSYGIMDLTPVIRPVSVMSETEAQRRDLKRRYKAIFGYKPVEQDLTQLCQAVETAEADRALKI